jgi:hypothetical protein
VPDLELTEELIAEATARAEKVACRPDDDRCYPLSYDVESAQQTCSAQRAPEGPLQVQDWGRPKGRRGRQWSG